MKRTPLKLWVLALALVALAATLALAQPDSVLIANQKAFGKLQRPEVNFPHAAHMAKLECTDCHHRYKNHKNVLDPGQLEEGKPGTQCADCHAKPGSRFSPDLDPSTLGLMQAYHKQCLNCHRVMAQKGKTGPRTCGGCHKVK